MNLRGRIAKLYEAARQSKPAAGYMDLDDFVTYFEQFPIRREPDFDECLAEFKAAIEEAMAQDDPPYTPEGYLPLNNAGDVVRLGLYRDEHFPRLKAATTWLFELDRRIHGEIPPCGSNEFRALAKWFDANEDRLRMIEQATPRGLIQTGMSTDEPLWAIKSNLEEGPRAEGSGKLAERIRQLRRLYPA
jgi:hypothetical protein